MRIRIGTRLIADFMLVILLMVALSLYFTSISQRSLQQSVGKSSIFIAEEMLKSAVKLAPGDLAIRRHLGGLVALNLVHNRKESSEIYVE